MNLEKKNEFLKGMVVFLGFCYNKMLEREEEEERHNLKLTGTSTGYNNISVMERP